MVPRRPCHRVLHSIHPLKVRLNLRHVGIWRRCRGRLGPPASVGSLPHSRWPVRCDGEMDAWSDFLGRTGRCWAHREHFCRPRQPHRYHVASQSFSSYSCDLPQLKFVVSPSRLSRTLASSASSFVNLHLWHCISQTWHQNRTGR